MFSKDDKEHPEAEIRKKKREKLVKYFWITVVVIYIIAGISMVGANYNNKQNAIFEQTARMTSNMTEPGLTVGDMNLPANATPTEVTTGIYVDRISALSLKDSSWTVDFYIWFKWSGNKINPGDNFQIIDGVINKKDSIDNYTNGTNHYALYKVSGTITKFFDLARYPLDSHVLTIDIEDGDSERQDLLYVADNNTSSISSRIQVQGYQLGNISVIEKPHSYKTTLGDPRLESGVNESTHSQLRSGFEIFRPDLGYFFRIFIGMFIAVGVAFVALLRRPIDGPRFALGGSSLFVAIANMIIASQLIPNTGIFTLTDMVSTLCLGTILICLFESTFSYYLWQFKDEQELSKRLDRVAFVILVISFITILILVIYAAW